MLKPLADRVIVKFEEEKEEKTVGGLILTTKAASSSYATATVVACGAGKGCFYRYIDSDDCESRRQGSAEQVRWSEDQGQ